MQDEYMTIKEAAEALGVSRVTIYRRVRDGELEAYQSRADRRERLVRRADIEELMRPETLGSKRLAAHNLAA